MIFRNITHFTAVLLVALSLSVGPALAQAVPSSAQAERVNHDERPLSYKLTVKDAARPAAPRYDELAKPANADQIFLTLKSIRLEGISAVPEADLQKFWSGDIGRKIPLSEIYDVAERITKYYQDKGFILARAYIPAQEIDSGEVIIRVAEGRIGDVRVEAPFRVEGPLARAIADMRAQQPLDIRRIERWTLHLNSFYGAEFRVVFKNAADMHDPALPADSVVVVLIGERKKPVNASIRFDNSGSRYLGPNSVTATAAINYGDLHFQRTEVSYTTSLPRDELRVAEIKHYLPLTHDGIKMIFDAHQTDGFPGYTLETFDIHSISKVAGVGLEWTPILQRDEALTLRGRFEVQNNTTSIFGAAFSEDRIRALRLSARYEKVALGGINGAELRLDKGLDGILGASKQGDLDLSRAQGRPGFTKFGLSLSRRQTLPGDFELVADSAAQYTNTPLLSSEEFGYGGAAFGRAFDSSEIVGDKGVNASLELRTPEWEGPYARVQPFVFYDLGKVWNLDAGQPKAESGASAGIGARMATDFGVAMSLSVAKPLTREIATPQAYENGDGPRVQFAISAQY